MMQEINLTKSGAFKNAFSHNGNNDLFRGEIYSVERLEQFAAVLAAEHQEVEQPRVFQKLLPRLKDNGRVLVAAYKSLISKLKNESSISPAAEWLVDNFYIVEEQLREIQEDLPVSFYRELPKLKNGAFTGYPRIYAIAVVIAESIEEATEAAQAVQVEYDELPCMVNAYKATQPGAPLVHDDVPNNICFDWALGNPIEEVNEALAA